MSPMEGDHDLRAISRSSRKAGECRALFGLSARGTDRPDIRERGAGYFLDCRSKTKQETSLN